MNKSFDKPDLSTLMGLLLSLLGINIFSIILRGLNPFSDSYLGQLLFSDLKKWILFAVVILLVLYWEKRSFSSIGIKGINKKNIKKGLFFGILSVIIAVLSLGALYNLLGLDQPGELSNISNLALAAKLFTITTAAITEEIFYRGYAIERLTDITGNVIFAGVLSGIIFLAIHYPAWGLAGAIPQIVFSIFLITFYIKNRDLIACIFMHWIINFLMIIVLPAMMT